MKNDVSGGQDNADALMRKFTEICLSQDEALKDLNARRYNKLYEDLERIVEKIKHQDNDQGHRLVELFGHPSAQVRLKAAIHALTYDYEGAIEVLQRIVDRKERPQLPYAWGMLDAIKEGRYMSDQTSDASPSR